MLELRETLVTEQLLNVLPKKFKFGPETGSGKQALRKADWQMITCRPGCLCVYLLVGD